MNTKWITTVTTLIVAIIGFTAGMLGEHFRTERAVMIERLENITNLRSETYVDFFAAQAKLRQVREYSSNNDEFRDKVAKISWEYELGTKEGRMKLAAFAPTSVVEALAIYYKNKDEFKPCSSSWKSDVRTYLEMRDELLEGIEDKKVDPALLYLLMWDCMPE